MPCSHNNIKSNAHCQEILCIFVRFTEKCDFGQYTMEYALDASRTSPTPVDGVSGRPLEGFPFLKLGFASLRCRG
jgi:hypothetical protein